MRSSILYNYLFLFCASVVLSNTYAQGERDYWYFGMFAGMRFDGGDLQSLSDNTIERRIVLGVIEGPDNIICASNEDGELMFYSDGRVFRNLLHENMANSPTNEYSVYYAQAAISRYPGNDNKFYVFVNIQDGLQNYLTYTIVDMSLDGGLGGIDPNNTHVFMANRVGDQMVVARHANGRDSWLITLRRGTYYSYLITENGIATTPVLSNAGVSIFDGTLANFGTLEVSPDNKLIGAAFPGINEVHVLNFNDLNGRLSLAHEYGYEHGFEEEPNSAIEFSANSKVLYYCDGDTGIMQFNIANLNNVPDPILITESGRFPYLKRGPNDKIYSSQSGDAFINAINQPNNLGVACEYEYNVLGLSGTQLLDLPVFLQPKFPEGISFINICEEEVTQLNFVGSFREDVRIEWDLGDGNIASGENINHTFSAPGSYNVIANVINIENDEIIFTDSKEIVIYDTPNVPEPDDIFFCTEDTTIFFSTLNDVILDGLDPSIFSVRYYFSLEDAQLSSNEEQEYIPVIGTKTIWVKIENRLSPTCSQIVSFDIFTPEFITLDIPTEQYICDERGGLTLTAPDGFLTYSWSNNVSTQNNTVFFTGQYTLTVEQDFGDFTCEIQTTITVLTGDELPIIEDIKVLDWSQNHNSIEVILDRNGIYEYSVDGINYQESPIFLNLPIDDYYIYVRDARCFEEIRSDKLFLLYYNKFFTPNGDGQNDYWQIINASREENIEISIFDRYGRLLETMRYFDRGWDGTFNGVEMPTADYWFSVVRENGDVHVGHFTLKR